MADEVKEVTEAAVVLRFIDGRTIRLDSSPTIDTEARTVVFADGSHDTIRFDQIKAIFFRGKEDSPASGSLVSIEFGDGEVLRGIAPEYNPALPGFYLHPTEDTRIGKAFIVTAAVNSIDVERY